MALLAREHSPRLQALDVCTLEALLGMLRQPPTPEALLAALAAVAYLSDAYPALRWASLLLDPKLCQVPAARCLLSIAPFEHMHAVPVPLQGRL